MRFPCSHLVPFKTSSSFFWFLLYSLFFFVFVKAMDTQRQNDEFANPIILDTSLDAVAVEELKVHKEIAKQFEDLFPLLNQAKIIESTVPSADNVLLHRNYMHYLTLAWANHFSVIISPDIIFYTILSEIADEITTNPNSFRHLFTNSQEKKPIITSTYDATEIDLNQVIYGIAQNVAVDASIFTANFSSSTVESRLAIQATFCDAMSAYFYYITTMCGIPRVKVLGTKQDWQTLEHKIHRMRTEVFNQGTTIEQKMSTYLQRAETYVHRIHTTRDPAFWKNMFSINRCKSGHTDAVEGWILAFYRVAMEAEEFEEDVDGYKSNVVHSEVMYEGHDFYNYKSHISTVKWHNDETQRHFELKTGLLFSNVVRGDSEDDVKYPWLEPQFSHVIVETDGSGKMTPELFKKYIETTLREGDKELMESFYEVLKDDPIEFVQGVPKEFDFRFELVGRQIIAWKQEFLNGERALTKFDLTEGHVGLALSLDEDITIENLPALNALKEKIVDYLKVNTNITSVILNDAIIGIEASVLEALIGNPNIEELSVYLLTQESVDKLTEFLLHSNCKLKRLKVMDVYGRNFEIEEKPRDMSSLANALIKTTAPIEELEFHYMYSEELAKAIADLCTRPNSHLQRIAPRWDKLPQKIKEILIIGQVMSKTLKEVQLPELGRFSEEMTDLIVKNLPLNPSLEKIPLFKYTMSKENLIKALQIPSLKVLSMTDLPDSICDGLPSEVQKRLIKCNTNNQMSYQ